MLVEASTHADCRIDGMLAYRVELAGVRTAVPDDLLRRAFVASLDHSEPVCLYGSAGLDAFLWRGLPPVLNTSRGAVIEPTHFDRIAAVGTRTRPGQPQGRDLLAQEASAAGSGGWRRDT